MDKSHIVFPCPYKLIICGGYASSYTNMCWQFDKQASQWKMFPSMNYGKYLAAYAMTHNGKKNFQN